MPIIYGIDNTAPDRPVIGVTVDSSGHPQVDILSLPTVNVTEPLEVHASGKGYAPLLHYWENLNLPAGVSYQTGIYTCPAGYNLKIARFAFSPVFSGASYRTVFYANNPVSGYSFNFHDQTGYTTGLNYQVLIDFWLAPGWTLNCYISGATLNDDLKVYLNGMYYKVL